MPGYKIEKFDNMQLKLFAMVCMLCDHVGAVFFPGLTWMRIVGRIAFPIFAFEIAEGFMMTHNRGQYILKIWIFAVLAEFPYRSLFYKYYEGAMLTSVLATFEISLLLLVVLELVRYRFRGWARYLLFTAAVIFAFLIAMEANCDYAGFGVLIVVLFYFSRDLPGWHRYAVEGVGMYFINWVMMGGSLIPGTQIPLQGAALLAVPFIWLYNGQKGRASKAFRIACYGFYPAHLWLIFALSKIL